MCCLRRGGVERKGRGAPGRLAFRSGGVLTGGKEAALKEYFGFDAFRTGQEEVIDSLLEGRDAVGIMPTGAGKSLCFQIPSLIFEGVSLVVSPLISLMKDQVGALRQSGVAAAYLNSAL
ncbi:MAG: DEAD/DEAH box helicase, partial [Aminobacteriaceae bacterium]